MAEGPAAQGNAGTTYGGTRRLDLLATLVVTAVALALLWPVPLGQMPRSADHQVHLARAHQWWSVLASGHVRGWSDLWFLGAPIGELYPPLADMIVVAIKGLSLGLAPWESCYALAFCLAFAAQGWAMLRAGRALGLGPLPGLIAALLVLLDSGWSREGGWTYTVWFGVWPQVLANALCWLAFAELALAGRHPAATSRPTVHLGLAALWLGLALLAHPIALPMAVLGLPVLALCQAAEGADEGPWPPVLRATAILLVALALAAWWLGPMLDHRAWMAAYGWLHAPIDVLFDLARRGQWTRRMPAAVGHVATLGLLVPLGLAALALARRDGSSKLPPGPAGRRWWRFVAAFALGMWLASSSDLYWGLRLDRLSSGFESLQYQRFLIAAKPGFFLLAGAVITWLVRAGRTRLWPPEADAALRGRALGAGSLALALVLAVLMGRDTLAAARAGEVGAPQTERLPGAPGLEADYAALVTWARALPPDQRGRVAFVDGRNLHWFMDFTVRTGLPIYKAGFTPGDNFVHKPESTRAAVLDAAGVRYVVARRDRRIRGEVEAARFGQLRVYARPPAETASVTLRGAGTVKVLAAPGPDARIGTDLHHELRVEGAAPGSLLVFPVAAYPRWEATVDGEIAPLLAVPVWGDAAPVPLDLRASGALRGGKAGGDDGSEPTLLAVAVEGDALVELRYRARRPRDLFFGALSLLAACGLGLWLWRRPDPLLTRLEGALAPWPRRWLAVFGLVVALALALRWQARAGEERMTLHDHLARGLAHGEGQLRAGPLKADMTIHPAVVAPGRTAGGSLRLESAALPERLEGWFALDDDWAQAPRRGRRRIVVRIEGEPAPLLDRPIAHRPGRQQIALELGPHAGTPGTLMVELTGEGDRPPRAGFDLWLRP